MSKIVVLSAQLGAPQIVDGLLEKIAAQNPSLADWIKKLDTVPIIRECVENALNRLYGMSGIQKDTNITDYYGNAYSGKIDGVIRTDRCPKGLGLKITPQGAIEFVADDYRSEWKNEIERLRGLFTDAFLAEVTSSILQILGYEVCVQATVLQNGKSVFFVEGQKQQEGDFVGFAMHIEDREIYKVTSSGNWDRRFVYSDSLGRFRFTRNGEKAYLEEGEHS